MSAIYLVILIISLFNQGYPEVFWKFIEDMRTNQNANSPNYDAWKAAFRKEDATQKEISQLV
jgi:hypothetical protein